MSLPARGLLHGHLILRTPRAFLFPLVLSLCLGILPCCHNTAQYRVFRWAGAHLKTHRETTSNYSVANIHPCPPCDFYAASTATVQSFSGGRSRSSRSSHVFLSLVAVAAFFYPLFLRPVPALIYREIPAAPYLFHHGGRAFSLSGDCRSPRLRSAAVGRNQNHPCRTERKTAKEKRGHSGDILLLSVRHSMCCPQIPNGIATDGRKAWAWRGISLTSPLWQCLLPVLRLGQNMPLRRAGPVRLSLRTDSVPSRRSRKPPSNTTDSTRSSPRLSHNAQGVALTLIRPQESRRAFVTRFYRLITNLRAGPTKPRPCEAPLPTPHP